MSTDIWRPSGHRMNRAKISSLRSSSLNTAGIHPTSKIKRFFTRFPCEIIATAEKKRFKIQNPINSPHAHSLRSLETLSHGEVLEIIYRFGSSFICVLCKAVPLTLVTAISPDFVPLCASVALCESAFEVGASCQLTTKKVKVCLTQE